MAGNGGRPGEVPRWYAGGGRGGAEKTGLTREKTLPHGLRFYEASPGGENQPKNSPPRGPSGPGRGVISAYILYIYVWSNRRGARKGQHRAG
jgi:hypothetical protein